MCQNSELILEFGTDLCQKWKRVWEIGTELYQKWNGGWEIDTTWWDTLNCFSLKKLRRKIKCEGNQQDNDVLLNRKVF